MRLIVFILNMKPEKNLNSKPQFYHQSIITLIEKIIIKN